MVENLTKVFYCKFLAESKGERILKIGQHLEKLRTKYIVGLFFDSQCMYKKTVNIFHEQKWLCNCFSKLICTCLQKTEQTAAVLDWKCCFVYHNARSDDLSVWHCWLQQHLTIYYWTSLDIRGCLDAALHLCNEWDMLKHNSW